MSRWHLGEIASSQANMDEAISTAKELKDMNALALTLNWAGDLSYFERNPAEVDRLASDLIELSTRHNFVYWLAIGSIFRGWARSTPGDTAQGTPWIERGIRDVRTAGGWACQPTWHERLKHYIWRIVLLKLLMQSMRRKHWLKDWSCAIGVPDCTCFVVYFSRLWVPMNPKLRLRSAQP
jgi:hypothetical protein